MPYLRADIIMPKGFTLVPDNAYVRIGVVEQVFLYSRDMIVQFIDGPRDDSFDFIETPVRVTTLIGSQDPETTPVPSCTVYGRGDVCTVALLEDGMMYALSPLDIYEDLNRENFPTLKNWLLFEVLNGLLVDAHHDELAPENTYLTFLDVTTNIVTKITGNPEKDKVFEKMVFYFTRSKYVTVPLTRLTDPGWYYDVTRSGPENNPEQRINNRMHKGMYVNGFKYCEDRKYSQPTNLEANLTLYSNTLTDLEDTLPHPSISGSIVGRFFEHATVIWFPDEEPTHVLMMGTWPTMDACTHVAIVEVPVYCLAGRKYMEREIIDEDLPTEERNVIQAWQRYDDQVRVLKLIPRDYINFTAHLGDKVYSERLQKSLSVMHPRVISNAFTFGYVDGYGYDQDDQIFSITKANKVTGSVSRSVISEDTEPYFNGSRYRYNIVNTNGKANGVITNNHNTKFIYEWNGGSPYETQSVNDPTIEFLMFTDGTNELTRRIDLDYYCNGTIDDVGGGGNSWSDGSAGGASNAQEFTNDCWGDTYRNGTLRWADHFQLRKTAVDGVWGYQVNYIPTFVDVEYDLFVMVKTVTVIDQGSCILGPGGTCTGTQTVYGIVMFEGVEYIIWQVVVILTTCPALYNFWPWIDDANNPERPTEVPYSVEIDYSGYFWYQPQWTQTLAYPKAGHSVVGLNFPSCIYSTETTGWYGMVDTAKDMWFPSDMLRVNIDTHNDSFCVRWESYSKTVGETQILSYPNDDSDTLIRQNGGDPHYIIPAATDIVELTKEPPE